MKKNRKLTALLVAACMTIPMAATTFTVPMVASANGTITLNDSVTNTQNLKVYQIFKGTGDEESFGVTGWGNGINVDSFINDLKSDDTFKVGDNNLFKDVIKANDNADSLNTAINVANVISSDAFTDAMDIRFAKLAVANKSGEGTSFNGNKSVTVEEGYYVIADALETNDGWTLGMLKVVTGDIQNVTLKRSLPTLKKEVAEEGVYGSVADYCIGEDVAFKITGELPDRLSEYDTYYMGIFDTLDSNGSFELPEINTIKIKVDGKEIIFNNIDTNNNMMTDNNCKIQYNNNKIEITFDNIKSYVSSNDETLSSNTGDIEITYTAKLTSNAELGNPGNDNTVTGYHLNNPNIINVSVPSNPWEDDNTATITGNSVKVFTYQLDIDKYEKDNSNIHLPEAKFKLVNSSNEYAMLSGPDENNKYTVTGWDGSGTEFITNESGKVSIVGLDSENYQLYETEAPKGYNKLTEPESVNIEASKDINYLTLTKLEPYSGNDDNEELGIVDIAVANSKGTQLPETGGIGTKIFYVLGGTLVIGSGAALVIKKRMGKDEE